MLYRSCISHGAVNATPRESSASPSWLQMHGYEEIGYMIFIASTYHPQDWPSFHLDAIIAIHISRLRYLFYLINCLPCRCSTSIPVERDTCSGAEVGEADCRDCMFVVANRSVSVIHHDRPSACPNNCRKRLVLGAVALTVSAIYTKP